MLKTNNTKITRYTVHVQPYKYFIVRLQCLVSALHMLLQYMCAYVRLGHTHPQGVGGGWGGIEGIGELYMGLYIIIL